MISNTKSQILRFELQTTGLNLSTSSYNPNNFVLQFRAKGPEWSDWSTLATGSRAVTVSGSRFDNLDPTWEGSSDQIKTTAFAGVPRRGEAIRKMAILVPDISKFTNIEYRVVARNCRDCWDFFANGTPEQQSRALPEEVEGMSLCAVVATGSLYNN